MARRAPQDWADFRGEREYEGQGGGRALREGGGEDQYRRGEGGREAGREGGRSWRESGDWEGERCWRESGSYRGEGRVAESWEEEMMIKDLPGSKRSYKGVRGGEVMDRGGKRQRLEGEMREAKVHRSSTIKQITPAGSKEIRILQSRLRCKVEKDQKEASKKSDLINTISRLEAELKLVKAERDAMEKERDDNDDALTNLKKEKENLIKEHNVILQNFQQKLTEEKCFIVKEYNDHINRLKQEKDAKEKTYDSNEQKDVIKELICKLKKSEDAIQDLIEGKEALVKEHDHDIKKHQQDQETLIKGHKGMIADIVKLCEQKVKIEQERCSRFEDDQLQKSEQIMNERPKWETINDTYETQLEDAHKKLLERSDVKKERDLLEKHKDKEESPETIIHQKEVKELRETIRQLDRETELNEAFLEESREEIGRRDKIIWGLSRKLKYKQ